MAVTSNSAETSAAVALLESVYGPANGPNFPLPMPSDEAGLCCDGRQRRYLWTDAFGVLAYVSLADRFDNGSNNNKEEARKYREAAERLVEVVHECLGKPRSNNPVDEMQPDTALSPTGFVGLRIGKVRSRKVTDYGMSLDGQYWHYVDKWLLALARTGSTRRVIEAAQIAKSLFPFFFDAGPRGDGRYGGIRWKLSVDATPPPELQQASASDDTLTALIVFSIIEKERSKIAAGSGDDAPSIPSLAGEIALLKTALESYTPRVTNDPLGWGLEAMYDQFLRGRPRTQTLASLRRSALHPSHLSLPFRLYGAMIGARVAGDAVAPPDQVDELVELSLQHEAAAEASGYEEHSTINRGR